MLTSSTYLSKEFVYFSDWKVKVFPWEPSKFWWALCYVAFCLVPPSHCFFQVSPGSTLTSFFLLQKSNRPGFVFSVNQCQHHSASCMQHAHCKIVLEDSEFANDQIFLAGTSWFADTSPMSRCLTFWKTFFTKIERMLTSRWFFCTGKQCHYPHHLCHRFHYLNNFKPWA